MSEDQTLHDKIAIVTGASSGIGRSIATQLAGAGARVVVAARRAPELDQLVTELPGALAVECDVTSEADVARLVAEVTAAHGRVDVLINNAGVGSFAPVVETTLEDWQRMLDVNLTGSFLCARAVLPAMLERGDGWIVNVCSDVSRRVFAGGGGYCASKYGQYALGLALGAECRPRGVRVGAILPGMVQTEFANGKPDERNDWILQPRDVAEAVLFMVTRPAHAVVDELTIHPVQQEY
ncbi:MAG: family oxidoreductase [Thermoleophilia bacterium]|nr:family oxidoreductase [Thermoleophilia bacterium]